MDLTIVMSENRIDRAMELGIDDYLRLACVFQPSTVKLFLSLMLYTNPWNHWNKQAMRDNPWCLKHFNTLKPGQNGRHFADDSFK